MKTFLDNPVYHALLTGNAHMAFGSDNVKYFDREISPFAGFKDGYGKGFEELHDLLSPESKILYATRKHIDVPDNWMLIRKIEGLQFVFSSKKSWGNKRFELVPLETKHVQEMIALTAITKPGPFDKRTIEFGNYFGIVENNRLAAMAGERVHVPHFTEVSAICTHPDFLGKGYARALLEHQVDLILEAGQTPFLHVRGDNERAIGLYNSAGFKVNGPMNFYSLRKKTNY